MPYMKFLSVRSDICRQLPSDSTSRWTPLPLTMQFPLLGLARDFHPLDNAHAERTSMRNWIYSYPAPIFSESSSTHSLKMILRKSWICHNCYQDTCYHKKISFKLYLCCGKDMSALATLVR